MIKTFLTTAFALLGFAGSADAHVTAMPDTAPARSHFVAHFVVPHGCGGAPTVALRITLPDGLSEVKPENKPGWTINIERYKFAGNGPQPPGPPTAIEWRGGPLPDSEFETFSILMLLPPNPGTLYFPTVQTCTKGANNWVHIPAEGQQWHDVQEPAPFVRVTAAAAQ